MREAINTMMNAQIHSREMAIDFILLYKPMGEEEVVVEKKCTEYKISQGKASINVTIHANGKISIEPKNGRNFIFCHNGRETLEQIGLLIYKAANLEK